MEPVINFIPVDIDPRNPETPAVGSVTFRIETDNPETDSVFYSLSLNNASPEDPLFHEYEQGSDLTVTSDGSSIYYILIKACSETGDEANLTVPLYFSTVSQEESPEEEPSGDEPSGDEPSGDEPSGDEPLGISIDIIEAGGNTDIPVDIDPRNPETPAVGSVTFRIETDNPETDSVFYSLSLNNASPEDPLFHEYEQGRDITVVSDDSAVYYILIRAFDETGAKASLTVPLYFSAISQEEPPDEEDTYDSEGHLVLSIDIIEADENPSILVENIIYTAKFTAIKGTGLLKLVDIPPYILVSDNPDIINDGVYMDADHTEYEFNFMVSSCHNKLGFDMQVSIDGDVDTIHFDTATESTLYPYKGNRILWKKVKAAKYYNIYRSEDIRNHMTLISSVFADTYSKSDYQWYVDREGSRNSAYAVAPVDADGNEGCLSYPRFSPDKIDNMCLVQGSIINLGAKGIENVPIVYRIKEYPTNISSSLILKTTNICYTDERGFFELLVPQNSIIMLVIDDVGFKRSLVIPPVEAVNLDDLLSMPQNRTF